MSCINKKNCLVDFQLMSPMEKMYSCWSQEQELRELHLLQRNDLHEHSNTMMLELVSHG